MQTSIVSIPFQGIIDQVQKHKLLFIETQDAAETSLALINYQKVCIYILSLEERSLCCKLVSTETTSKQSLSDMYG